MKKYSSPGFTLHTGLPMLVVIFVVTVLTILSIGTLSSALTGRSLTNKIVDKKSSYYYACNIGETALNQIDDFLINDYRAAIDKDDFWSRCQNINNIVFAKEISSMEIVDDTVSFEIPVNDDSVLSVSIRILYPDLADSNPVLYKITKWETRITSKWKNETTRTLYTP